MENESIQAKLSNFDGRLFDLKISCEFCNTWLSEASNFEILNFEQRKLLVERFLRVISPLNITRFIQQFYTGVFDSYLEGIIPILDECGKRYMELLDSLLAEHPLKKNEDSKARNLLEKFVEEELTERKDAEHFFESCFSSLNENAKIMGVDIVNFEEQLLKMEPSESSILFAKLNESLKDIPEEISKNLSDRQASIHNYFSKNSLKDSDAFFSKPSIDLDSVQMLVREALAKTGFSAPQDEKKQSIYMYQNYLLHQLPEAFLPINVVLDAVKAILTTIDVTLGEVSRKILDPDKNIFWRESETPQKGTFCISSYANAPYAGIPIIYCRYDGSVYTACQLVHECAHAVHYYYLKETYEDALSIDYMDMEQSEGFALYVESKFLDTIFSGESLRVARLLIDWRFLFILPLFSLFEENVHRDSLCSVKSRQKAFSEAWTTLCGKDMSHSPQYTWLLYPYHEFMPGNGMRFFNALIWARSFAYKPRDEINTEFLSLRNWSSNRAYSLNQAEILETLEKYYSYSPLLTLGSGSTTLREWSCRSQVRSGKNWSG